jgi:hypothetical protein
MPLIIDETNYQQLLGNGVQQINGVDYRVHTQGGEHRILAATPRQSGRLCGSPFRTSIKTLPRDSWPELIKRQKLKKKRISDYQKFAPHDQNGLPTCWANGPAHAFTTLRVIQNLPLVYMSGCSVAVPISGGHSGGNEADAGDYSIEHGWASQLVWPNNSTDRSLNGDPKVVADRKHHTSPLIVDASDGSNAERFAMFATFALLELPFAVAFNWWSHVISGGDLVQLGANTFGIMFRNNWGNWGDKNDYGQPGYVTMAEGHGTPDSGFAYVHTYPSLI